MFVRRLTHIVHVSLPMLYILVYKCLTVHTWEASPGAKGVAWCECWHDCTVQDVEEPDARAAFIWILGEHGQGIQVSSRLSAASNSQWHGTHWQC